MKSLFFRSPYDGTYRSRMTEKARLEAERRELFENIKTFQSTTGKTAATGLLATSVVSSSIALPHRADDRPGVKILAPVDAVTFTDTNEIYLPARIVAERLGSHVEKLDKKTVQLGDEKISTDKSLYDGRALIPLKSVAQFGGEIQKDTTANRVTATLNGNQFDVNVGAKRIEVDQSTQTLKAYQGDVVIMETRVSTGGPGHRTPNGTFNTGPYKSRMHYSRLYNNAPMPYSIQVNGNIFFHGFGSVPSYPASHGCIRIPLGKKNPAKFLYQWADKGVETKIFGKWQSKKRKKSRRA
jgi:lipoprotein-anchoring transpeptidase ErfK/SrfK